MLQQITSLEEKILSVERQLAALTRATSGRGSCVKSPQDGYPDATDSRCCDDDLKSFYLTEESIPVG